MSEEDTEDLELFDVFNVAGAKYPNKLKEHLYINMGTLSEEFSSHSERFAWYATAYELASDLETRLKEKLARVYATLDHRVRMEGRDAGVKLTEKMVENTVITDKNYVELQEEYFDAKRDANLLKAARDAMIHRRDMMIQMGANYRAEGASDISLKQDNYLRNKRQQ